MDVYVEVLQDFPYYERLNKPGEVIPLPVEDARFWDSQGVVSLKARTVRVGSRTIRQEVYLGNVRHLVLNASGELESERRALVTGAQR